MNFNRMIIREKGATHSVFKMKIGQVGMPTDMAQCRKIFYVNESFGAKFTGSRSDLYQVHRTIWR